MTGNLDLLGPHRGPCMLCGAPDARHRLGDAIRSRYDAGESTESLAHEYGITVERLQAFLSARE